MKTKSALTLLFMSLFSFSILANEPEDPVKLPGQMSKDVKAVVENKCYGCHNTDSKNDKAKEDLDFKTLDDLSKIKKISAYKEIIEVLEENEMPPKKFLDHYPDKKLTEAEKKAVMVWAKKEAESLVKGM